MRAHRTGGEGGFAGRGAGGGRRGTGAGTNVYINSCGGRRGTGARASRGPGQARGMKDAEYYSFSSSVSFITHEGAGRQARGGRRGAGACLPGEAAALVL